MSIPLVPHEDTLNKIYYDARTGLRSERDLYLKAHAVDNSITYTIVKKFLKAQETHQIFHTRHLPKTFYPLQAHRPFQRIQIDLLDLTSSKQHNSGYGWIMNAVDVYTRYAIAIPLKTKTTAQCFAGLKTILKDIANLGFRVLQIDSDNEPAFLSKPFKKYCADLAISQNLSLPLDYPPKGIVERFNGTLRTLLTKYLNAYKTRDWYSHLSDLLENYNTSVNRGLGTTPTKAIADNSLYELKKTLQIDKASHDVNNNDPTANTTIKVGDEVRVQIKKTLFEKGSSASFSKAIYTVEDIQGLEYYISEHINPYRKRELLKVTESKKNPYHQVDEKEEKELYEAEEKEDEEARNQRRLNREGIEPHKYSGDPNNSLEYRFAKEVEALKGKRRGRA